MDRCINRRLSSSRAQSPMAPRKNGVKKAPKTVGGNRISREYTLLLLIGLRILNALSVKTFFQPDEYFQSLEPAWEIAFGKDSGAWITWVGLFRSAPKSLELISNAGMGPPAAIITPPGNIRCGVLCWREVGNVALTLRVFRCHSFDCSSQSGPGGVCWSRGLLHMQTCRSSLRGRE